jgi:hypothetical protein
MGVGGGEIREARKKERERELATKEFDCKRKSFPFFVFFPFLCWT